MDKQENREKLNKDDVLFITAETGYGKIGLEKGGYRVFHPYNFRTIVGRLLLELLIRLKLPQKIMFNRTILKNQCEYIIVEDSIVTRQFLVWLRKNCKNSQIYYKYTNMVGKAHHLFPNEIPKGIKIWTYDRYDSDKYGINLSKCGGYYTSYIGEKREKKYDIMYIGKDKGRAKEILSLKKQFEDMGLRTKFLIMPTTRFSAKKSFYSKPISYEDVIKIVTESRAILNIALREQKGATLRDYESIFNEVKLITTNKSIENFDFYDKNNIFVIEDDDMMNLKEFILNPYKPLRKEILSKYSLDSFVEELIGGEK